MICNFVCNGSVGHGQNLDFDFGYVHWFKGSYFDSPAIIAQMPAGGNKDSDYFYASDESQNVRRSMPNMIRDVDSFSRCVCSSSQA